MVTLAIPCVSNKHDVAVSRALSDADVAHRFVLGTVYNLPFGRGRCFGADASGISQALFGGWQVNSIINLPERLTAAVYRQEHIGRSRLHDGAQQQRPKREADGPRARPAGRVLQHRRLQPTVAVHIWQPLGLLAGHSLRCHQELGSVDIQAVPHHRETADPVLRRVLQRLQHAAV